MPGSRPTEASRLLPVLGATLQRLASQLPDLVPVVPAAAPVAEAVRAGAGAWPVRPIIVSGTEEKHDAFAASAAALTKSGTSTLELALANVPMLVTYRVNPLTAAIARRLVKVSYASLLNLLAGREVVPELLQENCTPDKLVAAFASPAVRCGSITHAAGMVSDVTGPPSPGTGRALGSRRGRRAIADRRQLQGGHRMIFARVLRISRRRRRDLADEAAAAPFQKTPCHPRARIR